MTRPAARTLHSFCAGMRTVLRRLREDRLLLVLVAALAALGVVARAPVASYASLVDWNTIAALTGLLALTKGLELSSGLHRLGLRLIDAMATERATALCLVVVAALLSTAVTNDVALLVVVPLTRSVCRVTKLPATRLIVFEALAVNAGSALTPIGNPQNLFLWQLFKVPFGVFVWQMLPLVLLMMAALLVLTACAFPGRAVQIKLQEKVADLDVVLLSLSLALYVPFLLATEFHQSGWAVACVLLVFAVLRPKALEQLDWGLLLVLVLMFVDLRLLAGLSGVRDALHHLDLAQPRHLYLSAIGASQFISNVPAAIALSTYTSDWRVVAYAVTVGGFGFMVGSLANLIALRLSGDPRAWIQFHAYAVPFLALAGALGYALLFGVHTS